MTTLTERIKREVVADVTAGIVPHTVVEQAARDYASAHRFADAMACGV